MSDQQERPVLTVHGEKVHVMSIPRTVAPTAAPEPEHRVVAPARVGPGGLGVRLIGQLGAALDDEHDLDHDVDET